MTLVGRQAASPRRSCDRWLRWIGTKCRVNIYLVGYVRKGKEERRRERERETEWGRERNHIAAIPSEEKEDGQKEGRLICLP